jgi:hypothetical protein
MTYRAAGFPPRSKPYPVIPGTPTAPVVGTGPRRVQAETINEM